MSVCLPDKTDHEKNRILSNLENRNTALKDFRDISEITSIEALNFTRMFTKPNISAIKRLLTKSRRHNKAPQPRTELSISLTGVVVSPSEIPCDIITMNSRVLLRDITTVNSYVVTLAYPEKEDISKNRISLFSVLGKAIIGQKVGNSVDYQAGKETKHIRIEQIFYQPEAMGLYRKYTPS